MYPCMTFYACGWTCARRLPSPLSHSQSLSGYKHPMLKPTGYEKAHQQLPHGQNSDYTVCFRVLRIFGPKRPCPELAYQKTDLALSSVTIVLSILSFVPAGLRSAQCTGKSERHHIHRSIPRRQSWPPANGSHIDTHFKFSIL